MAARKYPLHWGRYWDSTLNVFGGCAIVDTSCVNCYAPWRAGGIQTATNKALYMGTTVWVAGRWTWNENITELPSGHPAWTYPLEWKGSAEPLLGPGQPSLIFLNSMADLFHPGRSPASVHRILE